jgi:serine/threonine protein kinase
MSGGPTDPTMPSGAGTDTEVHAEEAYCSACNQSFPSDTAFCPNDGARLIKLAAERDELIGRVLDERYEIRSPLGKGGMGTVYRGWQLSVDREVAIKVIHPKLSNDRSAVKRFLREARLASRLSQPNIVNVYDFGQSTGVLYLVMELLRGHTLAAELGRGRRINPKRTVAMASQLCDALEAAHAQGIVHRDLKPSNIVILDDPPGRDLIKVLDFGLAKSLIQDSGSVVTNTDALLGTPLYMSPEQIEGRESDQRSDLYSLGCILYETLSGKPPFVDTAVSAVLARHMSDRPKELPPHVPPRLRALIGQLLAKSPDERLQSAGEIRRVLDEVRESGPFPSDETPPAMMIPDTPDTIPDVSPALAETHAATPTPVGMVVSRARPGSTVTPSPARPRRLAFVALLVAIPLGIGTYFAVRSLSRDPEPARQPVAAPPMDPPPPDAAVQLVAEPPPALDAGVATAAPPPIDASVTRPSDRRERLDRSKQPRPTVDAGTAPHALPDIDFLDIGKQK